jgi:hypothetical protein
VRRVQGMTKPFALGLIGVEWFWWSCAH